MSTETPEARLEREIANMAANVANYVTMRRDHGGHGYLKTELFALLNRLEGMLLAWLLVSGTWDHAGFPSFGPDEIVAIKLYAGVDLVKLREDVRKS